MANKIIVCQLGSRHRYVIPKVISDSGMLYRLYTDSTAYSCIGKISVLLQKFLKVPEPMKRLAKRIPLLPKKQIFTTDEFFFKELLGRFLHRDKLRQISLYYKGIGRKCIKWGVGDSDCIYSMYIENIEFLRYAKKKGVKIVVDIYEVPTTYSNLIKELDEKPEYNCLQAVREEYIAHDHVRMNLMEDILGLADFYTVPSKFVIKSLSCFRNFEKSKVLYLPYASSITIDRYSYHSVEHRLIWVGNDAVRKGLVYCAKAADILKKRYKNLDFRIIGSVPDELKKSEAFSNLNFLGILNKQQLMNEYRSAEAYVFPTLFEGFAGTIIEAASCGCPIITTECAGTNTEEFPALYIPTRNVDAIVESVISIFENKELRDSLSRKVYNYSVNLSPDTYKDKLIKYLCRV